jgi:hypothetical protein
MRSVNPPLDHFDLPPLRVPRASLAWTAATLLRLDRLWRWGRRVYRRMEKETP